MGNPINSIQETQLKSKSSFTLQTYAEVASRVASRRNRLSNPQKSDTVYNQINNEHPIRYLMLQEEAQSIPNPPPNTDLDEIHQSRPRTISLLFGHDQAQRASVLDFRADQQAMETVMERLRRQLRNSSARVAQEAQLAHRERADQDPREQLERMRRVRQERLMSDNSVFQSAFYRLNNRTVPLMEVEDSVSLPDGEDSFPDHVFSRESLDRRIAALIRPRE